MMRKLTLMILAVAGMMACTESYYDQQKADGDQPIRFSATIAEDWNTMTRGVKFTGTTFNIPFSISGYRYGSGQTVADVANANFFYNKTVSPVNSEWIAEGTYTWPANGDLLDFYAYAPVGGAGITPVNAEGGLQINFTVQSNVDDQIDLMTSTVSGESFNTTLGYKVTLPFGHALTAVQFVLDKNVAPGTIKQIDLVNVVTTGTLHLADNTWHNLSNTTFTIKYSDANDQGGFSTVGNDGFIDVGAELVGTASPLLMIPQAFTSAEQGIRVIIDTGGSQPQTLYAKLSSDDVEHPNKWEPGKTVTYKISTSGINVLHVAAINYPAASTWGNAWIKSDYGEGDDVGLYAIDNNGEVQVDNIHLALNNSGEWTTDEGTPLLFTPDLTWFMYSPYKTAGLAHSGTKNDQVVTTAEDFFASGISVWEPDDNQSTEADLMAQDLQIATGTLTQASTLRFDMAHAMGIVHLSIPAAAEVPDTVYYNGNEGVNSTTKVYTSSSKTNVAPSRDFITNKPYDAGNNLFLFIAKPGNVTLSATSNSQFTAWDPTNNTTSVTKTVTANQYVTHDVTNKFQNRGYIRRGWAYEYSGSGKTFTAPVEGNYMFECWGASGGTDQTGTRYVGRGGYVCGVITLSQSSNLYVYVGGKGVPYASRTVSGGGGWNGGGFAHSSTYDGGYCNFGGGGSTDVRTTPHTSTSGYFNGWGGSTSLNSRIIVAAGGGGLEHYYGYSTIGGYAGGIVGGQGTNGGENSSGYNNYTKYPNSGATQIGSGDFLQNAEDTGADAHKGAFGYANTSQGGGWGGGGGGGYWGGVKGYGQGGSGGSSFISGHPGCIAITSASSTSPKGGNSTNSNLTVERATHYSSMVFTNTKMIDGAGYNCKSLDGTSITRTVETMPTPFNGTISRGGNYGHGYARITLQVIE